MPPDRRVLYLLRYYPTLTETFVYQEIRELRERGWQVEVGTLEGRADGGHARGVEGVVSRRPPGWPGLLRDLLPLLFRPAAWSVFAWFLSDRRIGGALRALWLARLVGRHPRVHVHFAGEAGEWALAGHRLFGVPYTLTVHAVDLFKPRPRLREILHGAEEVLAVSEYNRGLLRERYGVDARVVRCGVPMTLPLHASPATQPCVVLAVGRYVPKKGFDALVEAVERVDRRVRLLLVSDAPESLASERVRVLGLRPAEEVAFLLSSASLLALPARVAPDGDADGIPVVLMEALAAGIPVLTTAVSGIPELVDEQVGWLVPPDDPDALLAALEEAVDRPDERALRGSRGPARLRERGFTLDDQVRGVCLGW